MKKIHFLGLLFLMLTGLGFKASAGVSYTVTWETPGSVMIRTGSNTNPYVELTPDQTSFTYESGRTFDYIYIYAAEGYYLIDGTASDGTTKQPSTWGTRSLNVTINSSNTGQSLAVNCVKLERNDEFTIDVVNGVNYVAATFASGYTLNLQKGSHTYTFNPEIDGMLTVSLSQLSSAYQVTLDGVDVPKSKYYASYPDIKVTPGCTLVIRVAEGDEVPESSLTFEYAAGMENCLNNIYCGKFISPDDIKDNTVSVLSGAMIRVNFKADDYNYTAFYLNGTDITSSFNNNQLQLTLTEPTNTLKIEGTPKVYGTIDYKVYVTNPDNVEFSLKYGGEALAVDGGEAVTSDIKLSADCTMPADGTRVLTVAVPENNPILFFRPKAGCFLSAVYEPANPGFELHSSASSQPAADGTELYIMAEKLQDSYTAQVTLTGTNPAAALKASGALSSNWGNPDNANYTLAQGTQTISFIPGYSTPLTVSMNKDATQTVYVDGGAQKGIENKDANTTDYTILPYVPASADDAQLHTAISIFAGSTGTTTGASLVLENDMTAGFFYSVFRHEATPAAQVVLAGTEMAVKPSTADCYIKYKNEIVHGYKDDGTFVNGLNEAGEYVFVPAGNARQNVVTVGKQLTVALAEVQPADGATVRSITKIEISVSAYKPHSYEEISLYPDFEKISGVAVTKDGTTVASVSELGEISFNEEKGLFVFPLLLDAAVTEAGEYTVVIPAGALHEAVYNESTSEYDTVDGGYTSRAYSGTVTVDPNAKSVLDDYVFEPASGSTLEKIESITLVFPGIPLMEYFDSWEFPNATITNGLTSLECAINYNWNYEGEYRAMSITPLDDAGESAPIETDGTWTLTIGPGTFVYGGDSSGEITATYVVDTRAGISTVDIDAPEGITVVTTDGKVLMQGADVNELKKLTPGIYIVNGEKLLIKK